jgi:hypothetical protein
MPESSVSGSSTADISASRSIATFIFALVRDW